MSEFYDNLLRATNNIDDITTEKYGVITKINGTLCSVKEYDSELEHSNVPIVNGAKLEIGDKVIIGFLNNSIYDTVCYGVLDKQIETNWEDIKDKPTTFPPTPHNHISSEVTDLINTIYPIGSIYMSVSNTSPSILFGGTWEQIQDRFLLASGDTYNNGSTGGSADAVVVSHNHNIGNDDYYFVGKKIGDTAGTKRVTVPTSGSNYAYVSSANASFGNFRATKDSGESGTGKNMPPYIVVNVWKRTA